MRRQETLAVVSLRPTAATADQSRFVTVAEATGLDRLLDRPPGRSAADANFTRLADVPGPRPRHNLRHWSVMRGNYDASSWRAEATVGGSLAVADQKSGSVVDSTSE